MQAVISGEIDFLAAAQQTLPQVQAILWLPDSAIWMQTLQMALGRLHALQAIHDQAGTEQLNQLLDRALARTQILKRNHMLKEELKAKNNQLQQLTNNLEQEVNDRTEGVAKSKVAIETNVAQMNELARFITELSFQHDYEDVFRFLNKEVRKFHSVFELFFSCRVGATEGRIFYLRNGSLLVRRTHQLWDQASSSLYLANELGRPIGKVIALSISGLDCVAFFEHSLDRHELDAFVAFFQERRYSLQLAVDRIRFEMELKSASALWEQTFDGMEDPVAIIDEKYRLLRANSAFSADLPVQHCYQHFAKRVSPCEGCPLEQPQEQGAPQSLRRHDSIYEVRSYPIQLEEGHASLRTFVNHYLDVTKALELRGQVVQSEKMSAVGHLAGHIAHELNNPLAGIRSMAQILLRQVEANQPLHSDLQEVERAAARCHRIIENLLEFSNEKAVVQLTRMDLAEVVKKTLPLLKTALSEFRTELHFPEEPIYVEIVPQMFQQVVFNLVNNACQAMQGHEGTLSVTFRLEDRSVQLIVADTGPGISAENLQRIFQPFYTTKPKGVGTGLGLSMCKNMVERMNGTISVQSELGQGSQFIVRLPRAL